MARVQVVEQLLRGEDLARAVETVLDQCARVQHLRYHLLAVAVELDGVDDGLAILGLEVCQRQRGDADAVRTMLPRAFQEGAEGNKVGVIAVRGLESLGLPAPQRDGEPEDAVVDVGPVQVLLSTLWTTLLQAHWLQVVLREVVDGLLLMRAEELGDLVRCSSGMPDSMLVGDPSSGVVLIGFVRQTGKGCGGAEEFFNSLLEGPVDGLQLSALALATLEPRSVLGQPGRGKEVL